MAQTRPRVSLKKFITRHRVELLRKFTKLALEMDRCDVFDLTPIQKGLEIALQRSIDPIGREATRWWGDMDVYETKEQLRFSEWNLRKDLKDAVEKERLRLKIEEISRGTYDLKNPAPMSTPIEVLSISEHMMDALKKRPVTCFADLFRHHGSVGTDTREYLKQWCKFTPEEIKMMESEFLRFGHRMRENED